MASASSIGSPVQVTKLSVEMVADALLALVPMHSDSVKLVPPTAEFVTIMLALSVLLASSLTSKVSVHHVPQTVSAVPTKMLVCNVLMDLDFKTEDVVDVLTMSGESVPSS